MSFQHNYAPFQTGIMLIIGTYIKLKIVQYLQSNRISNTIIQVDDLILFEHRVNFINGPVIIMQLLCFWFPITMTKVLGNIMFSSLFGVCGKLALFHRAIGGLGIAGVRYAHITATQILNYVILMLSFSPK